jgi:hypothetical protein
MVFLVTDFFPANVLFCLHNFDFQRTFCQPMEFLPTNVLFFLPANGLIASQCKPPFNGEGHAMVKAPNIDAPRRRETTVQIVLHLNMYGK